MPPSGKPQQFVVLPARGIQATTPAIGNFLAGLESVRSATAARSFAAAASVKMSSDLRVLDSIHENGAKLIEMTTDTAKDLLANQPGLRIVPVVYYRPAVARPRIEAKLKAAATAVRTRVTVKSAADGSPVRGATVVAFTDFANRVGAQGTTNAQGAVGLNLGGAARVERLYVYTEIGFWGAFKKNVRTASGIKVVVTPLDLGFTDALRHYYGTAADTAGQGVTVGVVDTGVGPHQDLVVAGGENTVLGEAANDFGDNGAGHGTHVGGIVAARGTPPGGIRGLAPAAVLMSYRVFGKGAEGASNFAIAKAIDRAVTAGCDLVNLSLGGGDPDEATEAAIAHARQSGTLVIAAAGNDDRSPVSFPGRDGQCLAVSALGRKGTYPKGAEAESAVAPPAGKVDRKEFVAGFSNVGPEIDLTAPGVGILSTVPGGYAVMDGTSMASPAVTGFAAALLARLPAVLGLPRDEARSDAMAKALLTAAQTRRFPAELEGRGLPLS